MRLLLTVLLASVWQTPPYFTLRSSKSPAKGRSPWLAVSASSAPRKERRESALRAGAPRLHPSVVRGTHEPQLQLAICLVVSDELFGPRVERELAVEPRGDVAEVAKRVCLHCFFDGTNRPCATADTVEEVLLVERTSLA